jgi:phosphoglycolate phosphatase
VEIAKATFLCYERLAATVATLGQEGFKLYIKADGGMTLMAAPIAVDLIVFDLVGTLIDSFEATAAAANYTCRSLGLPEHSLAEISRMTGGGEKKLVRAFLGPDHQGRLDQALSLYLDYYSRHGGAMSRVYPGVVATLKHFRGKKLAVLSNLLERITRQLLEGVGLRGYFTVIRGGDSYQVMKPAPEALILLMQELEASPGRTLMLGDRPGDIQVGRGAGAHTVAVAYGYGDPAALAASVPDNIIQAITDLTQLVL